MMPGPAASPGRQPERLGIDLPHLRVEVGQLQPGQLPTALVVNEPAGCRRRVRPRVVGLPVPRAHLPPRNRMTEVSQPQPVQRGLLR